MRVLNLSLCLRIHVASHPCITDMLGGRPKREEGCIVCVCFWLRPFGMCVCVCVMRWKLMQEGEQNGDAPAEKDATQVFVAPKIPQQLWPLD